MRMNGYSVLDGGTKLPLERPTGVTKIDYLNSSGAIPFTRWAPFLPYINRATGPDAQVHPYHTIPL
jgi:hypothetical protein